MNSVHKERALKKVEDLRTFEELRERLALHEKWLHQIAEEIGIALE